MSHINVPEHDILTCDRCGAEGVAGQDDPFKMGGSHLQSAKWGTFPDPNQHYDLCYNCFRLYNDFIAGLAVPPL
jgi:hypothetical protein